MQISLWGYDKAAVERRRLLSQSPPKEPDL